ncbi:MAG: ZPR1 zinc finger domain-containing protein [Nanoarchaeota archaeon]
MTKSNDDVMKNAETINGENCPMCSNKTLTLYETEQDIPYFGKVFLFGMNCSSCGYKQSDVESESMKDPSKYEFTVENSKDLSVRIVKSSEATIKIPQLKMSVEPGVASEGYVSNIEGILQRFKKILELERDAADEDDIRKKAKNLLKKLWKVECGDEPLKIIIEDPTGNSAIISDKAVITKLKGSKK